MRPGQAHLSAPTAPYPPGFWRHLLWSPRASHPPGPRFLICQLNALAKQPGPSPGAQRLAFSDGSTSRLGAGDRLGGTGHKSGGPGTVTDAGPGKGEAPRGREGHPGKDPPAVWERWPPTCCCWASLQGASTTAQPGAAPSAAQSAQKPSPVLWSCKQTHAGVNPALRAKTPSVGRVPLLHSLRWRSRPTIGLQNRGRPSSSQRS